MTLKRYTTSHGTMCDAAEVADLEFKLQELKIASAELVTLLGLKPIESNMHELTLQCKKVLQLIRIAGGQTNEQ